MLNKAKHPRTDADGTVKVSVTLEDARAGSLKRTFRVDAATVSVIADIIQKALGRPIARHGL
jgi:hypothetical protein